MDFNAINAMLAFIEGLGLILSPCILPILPIMLSGSIEGGRRRPFGIIVGFALVFALFTVFSHFLLADLNINLDILRDIAFVLIALFGVVMMSSYLTEKFSGLTQRVAAAGNELIDSNQGGGFRSGLVLGGLVSLIWTPCAGPLLAAVLVQIAIQKTALASFITVFCFALGSVLPMILIALLGKKLLKATGFLKRHATQLRKILGAIITASALFLAYASHINPNLLAFAAVDIQPHATQSASSTPATNELLIHALATPYAAPALENSNVWINSQPLNLQQLKGKVILIDFWTYSCINCIRTLPYLTAWDKAYRDKGLVIIGVHTPEFAFERDLANVQRAVKQYGIAYPVLLDNQYITWRNFNNSYWPAHYLIDKNGQVVYQHFGEGEYETTEHNIQTLLNIKRDVVAKNMTQAQQSTPPYFQTPETYFGSARAENFVNDGVVAWIKPAEYHFPQKLLIHQWALRGKWAIDSEYITPIEANTALKLHFSGQHVYLVAGSSDTKPVKVTVLFNGNKVTNYVGKDVTDGVLTINEQRLYDVLNFPLAVEGELTLVFESPGARLYTFTFG